MPYAPPFTLTPRLMDLVSQISEVLGRWAAVESGISPQFRRENRIRSIYALFTDQVTDQVTASG